MTAPHAIRRVSAAHVEALAELCSPRDSAILATLNRVRLASGLQLERLHFADLTGKSRSVTRWRVLKRLTDWRLIAPLERRVGGSARGSAGMVYALDTAGARLLRLGGHQNEAARIRRPTTPGERKVKHSLAITELYTSLVERSRSAQFDLTRFDVEPHYPTGAGWISPDAYAVLATADVADHWWIEVDRATESPATVGRKIEAYAAYYQQGRWAALGVMPRVLVTVPDERRRRQLADVIPLDAEKVARIVVQDTAVDCMALTLTNTDG